MNTESNHITPFLFGESIIRTMTINSAPWFASKDVCDCLSIVNNRDALSSLHESEKITVANPDGNPRAGIPHEMTYVSESGLYALIFKSRKAEAVAFRLWVTSEVLPSIRKRGFYSHRTNQLISFVRELMDMGATFKEASILARGEFPPLTRKEQRLQEIEQHNAEITADPEAECFLSIMQPGIQYRLKDFFTVLPTDSRILQIKTPKGRDTAIGTVMERLRRLGRVRRVNARHATFELVVDNVVSIQR